MPGVSNQSHSIKKDSSSPTRNLTEFLTSKHKDDALILGSSQSRKEDISLFPPSNSVSVSGRRLAGLGHKNEPNSTVLGSCGCLPSLRSRVRIPSTAPTLHLSPKIVQLTFFSVERLGDLIHTLTLFSTCILPSVCINLI